MMAPARRAALVLPGLLWPACHAAPRWDGPLPVRNQHPAQLTVMHLPPAATATVPAGEVAGRLDVAYSSLFLSGSSAGRSFRMDGEYLRVAPQLRTGLGADCEVALELPFAHTSGGFLDGFLIDYHDAFGFPDQNRDVTPKGDFEVAATRGGQPVWAMEASSFEPLDVPLWLTWQLAEPDRGPGLALRAGAELPAGDDRRGYGNGEVDVAIGMLLEQRCERAAFYGHLQHTFAGTPAPARATGFEFADVTSLGVAAELPLGSSLCALAQVEYETSTLRDLGLPAAAREQFLLWIGARWRAGDRWALELAFGEDLQAHVSPDFTVWIGFTTLGAGAGP